MKKKLRAIENHWISLNSRGISHALLFILILAVILPVLFLSGCAKTAYPVPPITTLPPAPIILSITWAKGNIGIIYKYRYGLSGIKGFLIYEKWYKNNVKFSCGSAKLIAFQNLLFKKRFSLQYNEFFNNVNKKNLKKGYYVFCIRSEGNFGIESKFSNYMAVHIIR